MLINPPGGDDNLGIIVGTYQPDVQCMAAIPMRSTKSCLDILADMPATTDTKIFGEEGQAGVQEVLPLEYQSGTVISVSPVDPN